MSDERVLVHDDDGVRTVTWNRPDALNAMTVEMWDATRDALRSADADGARTVLLRGSGRAFTVGQDLAEFGDPRHADPARGFRGLMDALMAVPVPLVAAVNGLAVGFGLTVLPWCEVVLVADSARLRAPFVELGVTAEAGASAALLDTMGASAATWSLLSGEWIDAAAAVETGLALRSVPDGTLVEEANAVARHLADAPPTALRTTTALVREHRRSGWDRAVAAEYAAFERMAGSEENISAITAFFERR